MQDGDEITFGKITLTVIHTPGHTRGGISLYAKEDVFVGDTLFAGSIGRTDFPGGSFETIKESVGNLIASLADRFGDLRVLSSRKLQCLAGSMLGALEVQGIDHLGRCPQRLGPIGNKAVEPGVFMETHSKVAVRFCDAGNFVEEDSLSNSS